MKRAMSKIYTREDNYLWRVISDLIKLNDKQIKNLCFVLSVFMFIQISCNKEKLSSEKVLLSFGFSKANNPGMTNDASATIDGQNISITVPGMVDVSLLKAYFTSSSKSSVKVGPTIQESNKTINNFNNQIVYSVTAEDGTYTNYTITVKTQSNQNSLLTFGFTKADNPELIEDVTGTIAGNSVNINVSKNTDISQLKASFSTSPFSSVKVSSTAQENHKTPNNYIDNLIFTVAAENGSTANYTLTVTRSNESVEPLIKNQWVTFTYPYNAYFPYNSASKNIINGHEGNACGPTALAKVLHCLKYPVNGIGKIDFTDPWGLHYICDLTTLNLNYSNMPSKLKSGDSETTYKDVAKLFLAAGSVSFYLKIWAGTVTNELVPGLVQFFNLDPGLRLVNRWEISRDEWINMLKTELLAGRPVMIAGRTTSSPAPWQSGNVAGHWFNVDGFNAQGQLHVSYNYGEIEGYFDADNLGGIYISYNQAIVGFKAKP